MKEGGNQSVSAEPVPLSPRLLLFVHLEMSPARGLPGKRAKSLSLTIVFPIYWQNCRRDSTLFTRTCGDHKSLTAGVFIPDLTQTWILAGDHSGEAAAEIRAPRCGTGLRLVETTTADREPIELARLSGGKNGKGLQRRTTLPVGSVATSFFSITLEMLENGNYYCVLFAGTQ